MQQLVILVLAHFSDLASVVIAFLDSPNSVGRRLMALEEYFSAVVLVSQGELAGQTQATIYQLLTRYFASQVVLMEHTLTHQVKAAYHVGFQTAQSAGMLPIASIASHNIWQIPQANANYAAILYHSA